MRIAGLKLRTRVSAGRVARWRWTHGFHMEERTSCADCSAATHLCSSKLITYSPRNLLFHNLRIVREQETLVIRT